MQILYGPVWFLPPRQLLAQAGFPGIRFWRPRAVMAAWPAMLRPVKQPYRPYVHSCHYQMWWHNWLVESTWQWHKHLPVRLWNFGIQCCNIPTTHATVKTNKLWLGEYMSKPARKFFGTYKFRKKQNWNLNFQASVFPNWHSLQTWKLNFQASEYSIFTIHSPQI